MRSIQFLAALDNEEFIFVDREGGRMIEVAWQYFWPGERSALDVAEACEAVRHSAAAPQVMPRLQGEFHKALAQLQGRAPARGA